MDRRLPCQGQRAGLPHKDSRQSITQAYLIQQPSAACSALHFEPPSSHALMPAQETASLSVCGMPSQIDSSESGRLSARPCLTRVLSLYHYLLALAA